MEYFPDPAVQQQVASLISALNLTHIDPSRVRCLRSRGSSSRRTLARIHSIPKIVQTALPIQPHYVIEIISENFDKLPEDEKTKTLIHELLHIPAGFGGGFRHHHLVNRKTVEKHYRQLNPSRLEKFLRGQ